MGRTNQERKLARGNGNHIGRDLLPLADIMHQQVFAELAKRGYDDVRYGHQVVFINIDDEGSTLTELAARAKISKQAMHELVNDLEARGYIERVPSPKDGRAKLIRTTQRGEDHIETAWQCIAEVERQWTAILGAAGMKTLRGALRKLHAYYAELDAKAESGAA